MLLALWRGQCHVEQDLHWRTILWAYPCPEKPVALPGYCDNPNCLWSSGWEPMGCWWLYVVVLPWVIVELIKFLIWLIGAFWGEVRAHCLHGVQSSQNQNSPLWVFTAKCQLAVKWNQVGDFLKHLLQRLAVCGGRTPVLFGSFYAWKVKVREGPGPSTWSCWSLTQACRAPLEGPTSGISF